MLYLSDLLLYARSLMTEMSNTASPILAGGLVYIAGEDGLVRLLKLGSEKPELSSKCEIGEMIFATPAFVKNRIYIRSESRLYCIGAKE